MAKRAPFEKTNVERQKALSPQAFLAYTSQIRVNLFAELSSNKAKAMSMMVQGKGVGS